MPRARPARHAARARVPPTRRHPPVRPAPPPLLVVVTGAPGAGKTTLACALAAELGLPALLKDDVKEALFDTLGHGTIEQSNELGAASYEVVLRLAARMLEAGVDCLLEANFSRSEPFAALPPARIVQLFCTAPAELVAARYVKRVRHPGHVDQQRQDEVGARVAAEEWRPLSIGGELIEVDTTGPVDARALALRILG